MNRSARWKPVATLLLALAVALLLAACGSNVKSKQVAEAKAAGEFGLTVQAYKSGQFLLDGAILSSMDLSSHFAYLRDQGRLPKNVLLERSDKSKIRKDHLRYMASMAYTYGFTVYYDDDGSLRKIVPSTDDKKVKLRGAPPPGQQRNPELERNSAAHSGTMPDIEQQQQRMQH